MPEHRGRAKPPCHGRMAARSSPLVTFRLIRLSSPATALCLLAATAPMAEAADVQFDGWYRARMRMYDTLSLNRDLAESEGTSWYAQHRLWLKPKFLITDDVAAFAEIRGLDGVYWGDQPTQTVDAVTTAPPTYEERGLTAPTDAADGQDPLRDLTLWRVWGEARTPVGTFSFGRMPLHWGQGIWLNDGLCDTCDYGDPSDRLRWEALVQKQIWVSAAVDVDAEGFLNDADDTTAYDVSAAWRDETLETGLWATWTRAPSRDFNLVSLDANFDATLGRIHAATEVVGQFGGGTLSNGINDAQITAVGAVLTAGLDLSPWNLQVEAGFASGDGDDRDNRLRVFTFDRDHTVGIVLFEQVMPVLGASVATEANGGRDFDAALTSNAVSNALYAKPTVRREVIEGLWVEQSAIGARTAKVPDSFGSRRSYGMEFDTTLRYRALEHFEAAGTFGAFLPGTYYRDYSDGTYDGFDAPVFAGQLQLRVDF